MENLQQYSLEQGQDNFLNTLESIAEKKQDVLSGKRTLNDLINFRVTIKEKIKSVQTQVDNWKEGARKGDVRDRDSRLDAADILTKNLDALKDLQVIVQQQINKKMPKSKKGNNSTGSIESATEDGGEIASLENQIDTMPDTV